jgi:hypothetical protein
MKTKSCAENVNHIYNLMINPFDLVARKNIDPNHSTVRRDLIVQKFSTIATACPIALASILLIPVLWTRIYFEHTVGY